MTIRELEIHDLARQMLERHGGTAIADAAQKARAFENRKNKEEGEFWRHIEAAMKLMRGPHES